MYLSLDQWTMYLSLDQWTMYLYPSAAMSKLRHSIFPLKIHLIRNSSSPNCVVQKMWEMNHGQHLSPPPCSQPVRSDNLLSYGHDSMVGYRDYDAQVFQSGFPRPIFRGARWCLAQDLWLLAYRSFKLTLLWPSISRILTACHTSYSVLHRFILSLTLHSRPSFHG
jgi:hypothetical protein